MDLKIGTVYIVATPIGNLKDITFRAIEVLSAVDLILCEDTRRTIKLLNFYGIKKSLISYHRHSQIGKTEKILELLRTGKKIALVSDSGTPGIADPGNKLIAELFEAFGEELQIIPIPGPSAITAIASVAGINMDNFLFLGFPPQKKGRKTFFKGLVGSEHPIMLYESPYRMIKTLQEIEEVMPRANVIVAKEITKMFEHIYRGNLQDVLKRVKEDGVRGEYTLIIKS